MRDGIKTTEFWVTLLATVMVAIQQVVWPDTPFPEEALIILGAWIAGRITEKTIVGQKTGNEVVKRSWKTSEFWASIVFSVVSTLLPEVPQEMLIAVVTYLIGRPVVKAVNE